VLTEQLLHPTVWITSTVEVRVGCPSPLPLLFDVTYTTLAREVSAQLAGFGDLAAVPYTGCHA
jgi:hypothetical protein